MTMSRYTHIFRGQESEAVAGLPDLSLPSNEAQRAAATGTDNFKADSAYKPAYKKLAKKADFNGNSMSLIGNTEVQGQCSVSQTNGESKALQMVELGTKKEPMSSTGIDSKTTAPDTIRTCNLRFRRPMLYPIEPAGPKSHPSIHPSIHPS